MKAYTRREPADRNDSRNPAPAHDSAAFGGLPEILNRSPRIQAQLRLDRSLNPLRLGQEADVTGSKAEGAAAPLQRKPLRSPGMFEASKVAQRVNLQDVETHRIRVEGGGADYEAYYDDAKAGTLELFEDDAGRMWINYVETNEELQGKGIGLMMLQKAVQEHGALYASQDEREYHEGRSDVNDRDDIRQLSEEGAALVNSAIRNGIMEEEWLTHPSMMGGHLEDDEEEGVEGEESAPLLDFSDAGLPPLPTEDFTWAVGYYKLFHADDGDSLEMVGVSVHAGGQEPVYKDFDYPLGADSEEQISQSLASYYEIGEDHVKVVEMTS